MAEQEDRFWIQVSEDLPSVQDCIDYCTDPSCGAVASFSGITREHFQGKRVVKLWYEGYVSMAERTLRQICYEAVERSRGGLYKIAVVHKLGDCPVGHTSVIIVCSSPHRREANEGTAFIIDELKRRVPIWKREVYDTDDAVWKENIEWRNGKSTRVMIKEGDDDPQKEQDKPKERIEFL